MATQIIDLGSLRFVFQGAYSSSTEYQLNDVVKSNNKLYVYINEVPSTNTAVTVSTHWAVAIEGFLDPGEGTAGQILTTTGSAYTFSELALLPDQDTHAGKIVTTDGTDASWTDSLSDLELTGDVNGVGALFGGPNGKTDYTELGTNVKTVATKALTDNVATITTTAPHGFFPFQFVTVDLTIPDAAFDGTYEIIDTPTTTSFTFASTAGNIAQTSVTGSVSAVPGYTNAVVAIGTDTDDYAQIAFRNASSAAAASTDILMYADNGTDFSGWIDMGITSSGFNDPEFTITGANDGYIFMSAPAGTTGSGNLVLATDSTGTDNKIVFAAGGLGSDNTQMEITPDVNVHIEIPTPSTSSTTGALTVVGGVGVQGDMNIEGDLTIVGDLTFGGGSTTTENLAVTDPLVFVGDGNSADLLDLGLVGEYTDGTTKYAGVVRDASDGVIKFFQDAPTKPTSSVNFAESGLTYADVQVGGLTASGTVSLSGTVDIQEMRETVVPVTISDNSAACDWSAGNIYWIGSAPSANFTVALTNVPTDDNRVMTINVFVTQGSTGRIPSALTIDGSAATIKWSGAVAPTPTSSAGRIDAFSFTLFRLAGAWTVLGSPNLNWG